MDRPDPDWTLYRSTLAVLREGSLSAAARALGLTQPTIGRHVQALETALGATLFTRSLHGLTPTESISHILPHLESFEATSGALRRALSQRSGESQGTVRLTASEVIGAEVLPRIIRELQDRHPGLIIELVLSNRVEDLLRRDADIAIRMVRPTQAPLVAQRIGVTRMGLFAHRDYLKRHGTPVTAADLSRHRIVGFDRDTAFTRQIRAAGVPLNRTMFSLRSDSDLAALAALRAACGIGVCHSTLAAQSADLVAVLPTISFSMDIWVAMHGDLRSNPRCRLAFDALTTGLTKFLGKAGSKPVRTGGASPTVRGRPRR